MTEEQAKDDILKLVRLVDDNKSVIPRKYDFYRGEMGTLFFAFSIFFVFLYICLIYLTLTNLAVAVAVTVASASLAVGFFLGLRPFVEDCLVQVCYKRLETCHNVETSQKPLLKALIRMRIRNPEFDLEQIYNLEKSMFEKEKLLEILYKTRSM